jgi:outer membrane protein insertion porin family
LLNSVKFKGAKKVNQESLSEISKQRPNRKILGTRPYLSIYFFGRKFFDSTEVHKDMQKTTAKYDRKINKASKESKKSKLKERKEKQLDKYQLTLEQGNWLMRAPGEPPVYYDSAQTSQSIRHMSYYVQSNGFFQGSVKAKTDTSGRKINVKYDVHEGKEYLVKNYSLMSHEISENTAIIDSIIKANFKNAVIKPGERYNEVNLTDERERVNKLLKNNGFYDFSRQFIFFNVDTLREPYKVHIELIVESPKEKPHHQFIVNDIVFDADVTEQKNPDTDTINYRNIDYILYGKKYSKRILENKIKIESGKIYKLKDIQTTQRHLASLDMFKFINISYEKDKNDTTGNGLIAYVRTSPLKKYQITDEWGLTVATQAFVPGPFGSINFKNRNIFGGFEVFEINLKASAEGYSSFSDPNNILRTQEYSGNTSLSFAEILFPFDRIRDIFKDFSPRTRMVAGISLTKRPEYDRLIINNSYQYTWLPGEYSSYNFSLIDINVINTLRTQDNFIQYLKDLQSEYGSNLIYSFNNSFVSNANIAYTYNDNQLGINKNSSFVKLYAEPGGTIFNIPGIDKDSIFGLKTYKYLKGSIDLRKYYPLSKKSTFAARISVGAVYSYDKTGALPYEKFYFAGGSNSNRAWKPRRMGPGSYVDRDTSGNAIYDFEQAGELLIENNYEYRFNITGFIDGAVFVDAGNIWVLNKQSEKSRPGSLFKPATFLSQIGVGTGFGIRLNFSFLILRFDIGIKTIDPAEKGNKFVLPKLLKKPPFGPKNQTVFNIGIGYPF